MKKKILTLGAVLTLVAVLVAPGAVLATTTGVTGTVIHGYTFTAPSPIDLGDMTPGTPKTDNSAGSLEGNNAAGYTVDGVDENSEVTSKGYMLIVGTGTQASPQYILENKLLFGPATNPTATADTSTNFLTTSDITDAAVPFYVSQTATYADAVQSGYSITITFTVTQN